MLCLASCAAFCRSAKLGSLNPLIERALSLSWLVVDDVVMGRRFAGRVSAGKDPCAVGRGVHPPGPGSHRLIRCPAPIRHEETLLMASIERPSGMLPACFHCCVPPERAMRA